MRPFLLALTFATLSAATLRAADPAPPPMWPVDKIEMTASSIPNERTRDLIARLTSPNFAVRESASKELGDKNLSAFPGLEKLVRASGDPELIARTTPYLDPNRFQLPAEAPYRVAKLIRAYEDARQGALSEISRKKGPDSFVSSPLPTSLIYLGSNGQTLLFYRIILAQEKDASLRSLVQRDFNRETPLQAQLLIASGKLDEAEQLLRTALPDHRNCITAYAALVAQRRGPSLNVKHERETLPQDLSPAAKAQIGMLLYRANGDFAHAADLTVQFPEGLGASTRMTLVRAGRLQDVGNLARAEATGNFLDAIIVAHLQKQDPIVDQLLAGADNEAGPKPNIYGGPNAAQNHQNFSSLNCFLLADRAEQAIAISKDRHDGRNTAFHLLCQQLRIREALAAIPDRKSAPLDMPRQLSDIGLTSEALKLLTDIQSRMIDPDPDRGFTDSFLYASELDHAGAHKEADAWRKRLFQRLDPIAAELKTTTIKLQEAVSERTALVALLTKLRNASRMGDPAYNDALLRRHQLEIIEPQLATSQHDLQTMLGTVSFWCNPALPDLQAWRQAATWHERLSKSESLIPSELYDKAIRIAKGDVPLKDVDAFVKQCPQFVDGNYDPLTKMGILGDWIRLLHRMNMDDRASQLVKQMVERDNDPTYLILLGDLSIEQGDFRAAADYYQQSEIINFIDAPLMYRLGFALARGKIDSDAGERLMNFAPLLVLGDGNQAYLLAQAIRRFEGDARANQWFDDYISRFVDYSGSFGREASSRARDAALAKGDFSHALEFQRAALFDPAILPSNEYSWVMANVALYHKCRALDAFARKDFPTLADALWRQMDNGPPDPDLLEKALPALRTADAPAAQKVLSRALDRLQPVVEDYPDATQYKTQLSRLQSLAQ